MANKKTELAKLARSRNVPDPFAPWEEKITDDYGLAWGKLIEYEWFYIKSGNQYNEYYDKRIRMDINRRYGRGEHDSDLVKKLITDGTGGESYTNYDFRPIQTLPKFIKLTVNQMLERLYEIDAQAIDNISQGLRDEFKDVLLANMYSKSMLMDAKNLLGIDLMPKSIGEIPDSPEEVELRVKLDYKSLIEVAMEESIKHILSLNEYDEIQKQMLKDLVEIGVTGCKHGVDPVKGFTVEYCDPADMVWSYLTRPNFKNVYYYGHVKRMTVAELQRISGRKLTTDQLEEFKNVSNEWQGYNRISNEFWYRGEDLPSYMVDVLFFTYKTTKVTKYKKKYKKNGGFTIIEKESTYEKPQSVIDAEIAQGYKDYDVLTDTQEVWMEGAMVLGSDMIFSYRECSELIRPDGYIHPSTDSAYVMYAPEVYQGRIQALVDRVKQYIDIMQQIQIKIQQFIAKAKPNGIWIDVDGLHELSLGEGNTFDPLELIRYYDETGNLLGTSRLADGTYNNGAIPIKELNNGQMAGLEQLLNSYNFYLNVFRESIGIGQGADGTLPHPDTSVGALENQEIKSNVATRYILDSQLKITQYLATGLSLRLKQMFVYDNIRDAFINSLGEINVEILRSIQDLHLHDFGIHIKLLPSAQDRAHLEQNIQAEIAKGALSSTDAIDIRKIGNITLANEMLKLRKRKNEEKEHQRRMEEIDRNAEGNAKTAEATSKAKQEEMALETESKKDLLLMERENRRLQILWEKEANIELMNLKAFHEGGQKIKEAEIAKEKEVMKEDRKDDRTRIQATQQSKIKAEQSKEGGGKPIDFEKEKVSLDGNFGVGDFRV